MALSLRIAAACMEPGIMPVIPLLSQLSCTVDLSYDETRNLGGYNDEKLRNRVFLTVSPSLPIMTPYHPRALSSMTRAVCLCETQAAPILVDAHAQVCERDRQKTPQHRKAPPFHRLPGRPDAVQRPKAQQLSQRRDRGTIPGYDRNVPPGLLPVRLHPTGVCLEALYIQHGGHPPPPQHNTYRSHDPHLTLPRDTGSRRVRTQRIAPRARIEGKSLVLAAAAAAHS
ncbi:hypothetical protein L1887_54429 [Cichorium endivia]|nr:hypothetical protein L1887_54429 [Cichorium endivia]